jgi:hypothetical protein
VGTVRCGDVKRIEPIIVDFVENAGTIPRRGGPGLRAGAARAVIRATSYSDDLREAVAAAATRVGDQVRRRDGDALC